MTQQTFYNQRKTQKLLYNKKKNSPRKKKEIKKKGTGTGNTSFVCFFSI